MRKYLMMILGITAIFYFAYINTTLVAQETQDIRQAGEDELLEDALCLLTNRKDQDALVVFEKILASQPDNMDALWGKAEILRRMRKYQETENILNEILKKNPHHAPSLTSLAYIRYKDNRLNDALKLVNRALKSDYLDKKSQALAYMMLGSINSQRSEKGWLLNKVLYGTHIKGYFLKAKGLAPDLPEVHLGLGTFYLLAPAIVGGDLDKAFQELELAVEIAPDFATVNARLAQVYKKKGNLEKYNLYMNRAKELDPDNEVLREIRGFE